jgi:hypothetical protein
MTGGRHTITVITNFIKSNKILLEGRAGFYLSSRKRNNLYVHIYAPQEYIENLLTKICYTFQNTNNSYTMENRLRNICLIRQAFINTVPYFDREMCKATNVVRGGHHSRTPFFLCIY